MPTLPRFRSRAGSATVRPEWYVRTAIPLIAAALLVAALAPHVRAQSASPPAPVPIPTLTYIGLNPLGVLAEVGTLEIETGVAPGITIGGVASYLALSHDEPFTTFDFKVRYYPGEIVLRGYSVGVSMGYTRFANTVEGVRQELSMPTLGFIGDRNWFFGRGEHFVVGTGIGAKRLLARSQDRARVKLPPAIVTLRLIVGFAF